MGTCLLPWPGHQQRVKQSRTWVYISRLAPWPNLPCQKLAMSVYGSLADSPDPNSWIRGTFGVEAGAGVELSWLIGFAFTGTTADMAGGAIMVDANAGLGPGAGLPVVSHLNLMDWSLWSLLWDHKLGLALVLGTALPLRWMVLHPQLHQHLPPSAPHWHPPLKLLQIQQNLLMLL
jgi:hypothetical protein